VWNLSWERMVGVEDLLETERGKGKEGTGRYDLNRRKGYLSPGRVSTSIAEGNWEDICLRKREGIREIERTEGILGEGDDTPDTSYQLRKG